MLRAVQPAIAARLCPVKRAMVRGNAFYIAIKCFYLFDAMSLRIVAIGAAAKRDLVVSDAQAHFRLVIPMTAAGYFFVTFHSFQPAGRRSKTPVQAAGFCRKFHKGFYRNTFGFIPNGHTRPRRESCAVKNNPASVVGYPECDPPALSPQSCDRFFEPGKTGLNPAGRCDCF